MNKRDAREERSRGALQEFLRKVNCGSIRKAKAKQWLSGAVALNHRGVEGSGRKKGLLAPAGMGQGADSLG